MYSLAPQHGRDKDHVSFRPTSRPCVATRPFISASIIVQGAFIQRVIHMVDSEWAKDRPERYVCGAITKVVEVDVA